MWTTSTWKWGNGAIANTVRDKWRQFRMPKHVRMADARLAFADLITKGETHTVPGQRVRAGPFLRLMDVLAGTLAIRVSQGTVATISFDLVEIIKPVYHGEVVHFESQLISINRSSMAVRCSGYRRSPSTNEYQHAVSAVITFVAINRFGRPRHGLPALYDDVDPNVCDKMRQIVAKKRELALQWRHEQEEIDRLSFVSSDMLTNGSMPPKAQLVPVKDTEVTLCNRFLPRHYNSNHTLFGGDLLAWMDEAALYCATQFTQNQHMVTTAMNRIAFKLPVLSSDIVTLRSRVCNVREHCLEVEVEVLLTPVLEPRKQRKSHSGFFTVANLDAQDRPQPIDRGLLIDETNQTDMKTLLKAQRRWTFEQQEKNLLTLPPLPLLPLSPPFGVK